MSSLRDLSQSEFEIMDVLWRKGRATVKEVQADLGKRKRLAYTTVATFLNRLQEKGYVQAKEKDFAYEFRPLVPRKQVVHRKLSDMVDRVLGGDVAPLAAFIAENRNLTPEQIAALEEIINSASIKEDE